MPLISLIQIIRIKTGGGFWMYNHPFLLCRVYSLHKAPSSTISAEWLTHTNQINVVILYTNSMERVNGGGWVEKDYNPCIQYPTEGRSWMKGRLIEESLVFRIQMGSIYCGRRVILTFWVNTALVLRSGVNVGLSLSLSLSISLTLSLSLSPTLSLQVIYP